MVILRWLDIRYTDSDFVGYMDTQNSTFGYVYLLAGWVISWKSVKQSVITASTMEVESVTCFENKIYAKRLQNFILRLGVINSIAKSLRIYCDNFAVVFFYKNDKYSKYFVVKEQV